MDNFDKIYIVGLGGIGSELSEKISRFINYSIKDSFDIVLIDGDSYEHKNLERQVFENMKNKAESKLEELNRKFKNICFSSFNDYINKDNINSIIKDNCIIFICVDNHPTRKLISDHASKLNNVILISGGNEYEDGNAQLFIKLNGNSLTPKITDYHPEIENPVGKMPHEMSCEELSQSEPQLYFANCFAAILMCAIFYNVKNCLKDNKINNFIPNDIYFDINTVRVNAIRREIII